MGFSFKTNKQFRALFFKNFALYKRQPGTTFTQMAVPLFLMLLLFVIQSVIDKNYDNRVARKMVMNSTRWPTNFLYPGSKEATKLLDQLSETAHNFNITFKKEKVKQPRYVNIDAFFIKDISWSMRCGNITNGDDENRCLRDRHPRTFSGNFSMYISPIFYYVCKDVDRKSIGGMSYKGNRSGWLDQSYQQQVKMAVFKDRNDSFIMYPFFLKIDSEEMLMERYASISRTYNSYIANHPLYVSKEPLHNVYHRVYAIYPLTKEQYDYALDLVRKFKFEELRPQGAIVFNEFDPSKVLDIELIGLDEASGYSDIKKQRRSQLLNMMSSATLKTKRLANFGVKDDYSYSYMKNDIRKGFTNSIQGYMYGLVVLDLKPVDIIGFGGNFAFAFAASFLLPVFLSSAVRDREERHIIMMRRSAALFGYIVVVSGVITSNLIDENMVFPEDTTPSFLFMIYPPFAFYRGLHLIETACSRSECLQGSSVSAQFLSVLMYLTLSSVVLIILTWYMINVTPHQFGIRKPYYFVITSCIGSVDAERLRARCLALLPWNFNRSDSYAELEDIPYDAESDDEILESGSVNLPLVAQEVLTGSSHSLVSNVNVETMEPDCGAIVEKNRIKAGDLNSGNCNILVEDVVKIYPQSWAFWKKGNNGASVAAVKNVFLGIRKGECMGLLGCNGAGKTSLISIITGMLPGTSGRVVVCGTEVNSSFHEAHQNMGVCQQFDILHANLTVHEHMLFYCRLRNLSNARESAHNIIRLVNLYDVKERLAKDLSGGMRRRLSIGIALCGNPSVLILDEPTTGLDPLSRQAIWAVLKQVKTERSLLITTHAMDEADALCDRIAIMWRGRIKCLGTPSKLKNLYGNGFTLEIYFDNKKDIFTLPDDHFLFNSLCEDTVRLLDLPSIYSNASSAESDFIKRDKVMDTIVTYALTQFPGCTLKEFHNDSCRFTIPSSSTDPSYIFKRMNEDKVFLHVIDWGLKMATMEDVFLSVTKGEYSRSE
eukprot:Nk52_evm22s370 gene=Nk52_evmTU22s370